MAGISPLSIRKGVEHLAECGTNFLLADASAPENVRARRGFKHTVIGHAGHQGIKVVSIPCICEDVEQSQFLFISHIV